MFNLTNTVRNTFICMTREALFCETVFAASCFILSQNLMDKDPEEVLLLPEIMQCVKKVCDNSQSRNLNKIGESIGDAIAITSSSFFLSQYTFSELPMHTKIATYSAVIRSAQNCYRLGRTVLDAIGRLALIR